MRKKTQKRHPRQKAENLKTPSVKPSCRQPKSCLKDKSSSPLKNTADKPRIRSAKNGAKPTRINEKRDSFHRVKRDVLERLIQERTTELRTHQIELEMQNEELRSAQQELEASRRKYVELYEFAPVGYFTFNEKGLIRDVNMAGANQLGLNKQALLKKPFSLFIPSPNDRLHFIAHKKRTFLTQQQQECELKLQRRDGTFFYARLESIAVENIDYSAGHIRTAVTDITRRKQAEDTLKRTNEELEERVQARTNELKRAEEELTRLATAVKSAADAVVITDSARGIIQYMNPAFEKITGYARDEALGRNLHMLDSGSHDQAFYQQLRDTLRREGFWTGRLVQKRKDGTLYEEECTYSPVKNAAGEIINYISIKRDVTEKARLESIAQAMDTMNNIGYIFAGVSHEIGTPINTIGMNLDMIRKKLDMLPKEKIADYLDRAKTQISRVQYLLHNLRNFTMYESPQSSTIYVSSFLDDFLAMVKEDFEKKGINIKAVLNQDAKSVHADPRALQQVLLNVFTNAFDALEGRDDPRIVITVSATADDLVKIQIKDNGCGIEETRLKDLFRPFYTTKKHGTGLGLVIIKKMVARMNGTVDVTSRFSVGSVVEICLPAMNPKEL